MALSSPTLCRFIPALSTGSQIFSFTTNANTSPIALINIPVKGDTFIVREKSALSGSGSGSDNVTGLIWEFKTDDGGVHDRDNGYTWDKVTGEPYIQDDFIAALNSGSGFGGHKDWRLPTIKELNTIVHRGQYDPAINEVFFPNTQPEVAYWSATTYAYGNMDYAWSVGFGNGFSYHYHKTNSYYVRAVRGGL